MSECKYCGGKKTWNEFKYDKCDTIKDSINLLKREYLKYVKLQQKDCKNIIINNPHFDTEFLFGGEDNLIKEMANLYTFITECTNAFFEEKKAQEYLNKYKNANKQLVDKIKLQQASIDTLKKANKNLEEENQMLKIQIGNMVKGPHFTEVLKENFQLGKRNEMLKELENGIPEDIEKINKKVDEIRQRFVNTYGGGIIHGKAKNYLNAKNNVTKQSNRK